MGIEPTTSSLGSLHSTAELRPLKMLLYKIYLCFYYMSSFISQPFNRAPVIHPIDINKPTRVCTCIVPACAGINSRIFS